MTTAAARRYADALLESVWNESPEAREGAKADLERLAAAVEEVKDLRNALENPSYASDERLRTLDAVTAQLQLSERIRKFTRLIVERGRATELGEIAATFSRLLDQRQGRVRAVITSAQPLDEHAATRIREALERRLSKQVEISLSVDESLIGGVRAQVGSVIFEGTIRAELDRLRERLSEA